MLKYWIDFVRLILFDIGLIISDIGLTLSDSLVILSYPVNNVVVH